MLVLENQHIAAIAGNDELCRTFPMFDHLRSRLLSPNVAHGCNCGGAAQAAPDYNAIKMALATMSQEDKDKFKRITGFQQVKIIYAVGHGTETVII